MPVERVPLRKRKIRKGFFLGKVREAIEARHVAKETVDRSERELAALSNARKKNQVIHTHGTVIGLTPKSYRRSARYHYIVRNTYMDDYFTQEKNLAEAREKRKKGAMGLIRRARAGVKANIRLIRSKRNRKKGETKPNQ